VAERLRSRVEQIEIPGFGRITASFGLATFPVHGSSRDTLLVAADRALYSSKHLGRNRISMPPAEEFQSGLTATADSRVDADQANLIQKV
jgi:predicted signal transduction protein with EAL and GGDEF domain